MNFKTVDEGFVTRRKPTDTPPLAAGSRAAIVRGDELACSYMVQSKLGINDFVPVIARSTDGGRTWREEGPVWPKLRKDWSMFVSLGRGADGKHYLYGSRYKIDTPGESFWSDATQGLKDNEMFWAVSEDGAKTWSEPRVIGNLMPGAAEAPAPLAVTRSGAWVGVYSPYNTFDPNLKVDREQVVFQRSTDGGKTWKLGTMIRFPEKNSGGAEAWAIELADGRLLGTTWHIDHTPGPAKKDYPNRYTLSRDGGATWSPSRSTGTMGHTTSLAALPDGRALFCNVRRKPKSDIGIWLSVVKPTESDFGTQHEQLVWSAPKPTQAAGGSAEHDNWTDFNFGEPGLVVLPSGEVLVVFWTIEKDQSGIRFVRLRME